MGTSTRSADDGLTKGTWSPKEDEILIDYVRTRGEGKWSNLAKETGENRDSHEISGSSVLKFNA